MTTLQAPSTLRVDLKEDPNMFHVAKISNESSQTADRVLEANHENNHIFFSYLEKDGVHMHNHIVHHALTLLALGADAAQVQHLYETNLHYQRTAVPVQPDVVKNLSDQAVYKKSLGNENNYASFVAFFEEEIRAKGVPVVINEYVFAEDFRADDMLVRLFMGCGIEFNQPAIVAEALAQAAVHDDDYLFTFYHIAHARAGHSGRKRCLAELVDLASANEQCRTACHSAIFEKIRDGVLKNAMDETVELASQYQVGEDEIELRTAELCNATAYIVAGAQRAGKLPRMDFFLMHPMNMTIFLGAITKQPWLSNASKARLLTYAGRISLVMHIAMGAPKLDLDVVRQYKPSEAAGTWDDAIRRAIKHPDDGHCAKMIRAVLFAEKVSQPYQDRPEFRLKGKDFEKLAAAIVDNLNPAGGKAGPYEDESWIRGAGFDDVWEGVPSA